jgi:hypothetical protein
MVLTVLMNALVLVAGVLLARVVVLFFGQIAGTSWARAIVLLSSYAVAPLGLGRLATPYQGRFDIDAAVTVVGLLAAEWVMAQWRRSVRR